MSSVDDPHHLALQARVTACQETHGWITGEGTYHQAMPAATREALRQTDVPTALYVRSRSDRVAVRGAECVLTEFKTTTHPTSQRIPIELLPLATHINLNREFDVTVLYVCHMVGCQFESAFTVDHAPAPSELIIPKWRWTQKQQAWFKSIFDRYWPDTIVTVGDFSGGSGDPFGWFYRDKLEAVDVGWETFFSRAVSQAPGEAA